MNEMIAKQNLKRLLQKPDTNALIFAFVGSAYCASGIPDWFLAHRIWTGWIEHKMPYGKISPSQRAQLIKLKHRGVKAYVLIHEPNGYALRDHDNYPIGFLEKDGITGIDFLNFLTRA